MSRHVVKNAATISHVVGEVWTDDLVRRLAGLPAGAHIRWEPFKWLPERDVFRGAFVWTRRNTRAAALFTTVDLEGRDCGRPQYELVHHIERLVIEALQRLHFLRAYTDGGPYG